MRPFFARTLRAVVAAARPRGHGFDLAIDDDVVRDVEQFLPFLPGPLRFGLPLGLVLVELGPPLFARRFQRFSSMPLADAQRYLESFQEAGGLRAALLLGLRTLVLLGFYQHRQALAVLDIDWQGRADRLVQHRADLLGEPSPPEHRIAYPNVTVGSSREQDQVLSADVVVVGSGAGGATAAARLRDAGLDVLIIEEGGLHRVDTFTTDPATMIHRLYRDAGTSMIFGKPPIIFAEGRCVGGSTVINGGMSWRTPEDVLTRWERELGLDGTGPKAMAPYFDQAERILHVEPNNEDTFGNNTLRFVEGAKKLGWPLARAPRNMRRCVGLNNCALGCPTGAKQGMHVTEIPRALAAGARLLTHARVDRVLLAGGRAAGVAGRLVDDMGKSRGRFTVRAPLVVLAAGARHTPAILKRSRIRGKMIGRGLHTHPNAKCVGLFAERLDPWIGTHQAFHVHHFRGDGILIGYAAVPPGLLAGAIPGLGEEHAARMAQYNHMLTAATLVEDEGEGRVVLGPDRQPYMVQQLTAADIERLHRGTALTAELMFAAGAKRVLLPFADLPEIGPDELRRIHDRPRVAETIELMTVHIMGTARMSTDAARGATDASGAVHGVPGLVVADASVLPTSVGVNPQESIIAMALRNADRWLEQRRRA